MGFSTKGILIVTKHVVSVHSCLRLPTILELMFSIT